MFPRFSSLVERNGCKHFVLLQCLSCEDFNGLYREYKSHTNPMAMQMLHCSCAVNKCQYPQLRNEEAKAQMDGLTYSR